MKTLLDRLANLVGVTAHTRQIAVDELGALILKKVPCLHEIGYRQALFQILSQDVVDIDNLLQTSKALDTAFGPLAP